MTTLNETTTQRARATADAVHKGIDVTAEKLHDTTENAADSAVKLAGRADQGVETLRAKQELARSTTVDYATRHPLRALAISLGIGFVAAKLLSGRSTRH